jgi:hypothetical protein
MVPPWLWRSPRPARSAAVALVGPTSAVVPSSGLVAEPLLPDPRKVPSRKVPCQAKKERGSGSVDPCTAVCSTCMRSLTVLCPCREVLRIELWRRAGRARIGYCLVPSPHGSHLFRHQLTEMAKVATKTTTRSLKN